MTLAALFALVLNLAILSGDNDAVEIVVAAEDIAAGTRITALHLSSSRVPANDLVTARFLVADEASLTVGMMATRPIAAGAPLLHSDLLSVANPTGLRAMSIPIDQTRAVAGHIERGDLVDVVLVVDGTATYVAVAIEVLEVPPEDANALGARSVYAPTVAVDGTQALRIAAALDTGEVHLVRSTGAAAPGLSDATAVGNLQQETSE
jgi:pilus assembly protein CpaB